METLGPILREHPFFKDLDEKYLELMVGCASNVVFREGEVIFHEGDPAEKFYLIRHGRVAVDIPTGQYNFNTIQTIEAGDILGWSWLIPPHHFRFQGRAVENTRAIALDGRCLREKCEKDHELAYELLRRFTIVIAARLENTRLQLVSHLMSGVQA